MRYPFASLSRSWCISPARAHIFTHIHIKACSGHFRRQGGTRPFHQDIRYAICSLFVPLYRVIFSVLVGTTTASRNALRLAHPICSYAPSWHETTTTALRDILAIYAYTCRYIGTCVCVRVCWRVRHSHALTSARACACIHGVRM